MHGHAAVSDKHEEKYRMTECRRETRKERAVGWKSTWDNASRIPLPRPKTQNKISAAVIPAHRAGGRIPMNFKVCSNLDTWERSRDTLRMSATCHKQALVGWLYQQRRPPRAGVRGGRSGSAAPRA